MKKMQLLAAAVISLMILPTVTAGVQASTNNLLNEASGVDQEKKDYSDVIISDEPIEFTHLSVILLGTSDLTPSIDRGLRKGTSIISIKSGDPSALRSTVGVDIVIIDGKWLLDKNENEYLTFVKESILAGIPVIVIGAKSNIIGDALDGISSIKVNEKMSTTIGFYLDKSTGESTYLNIGNISGDAPKEMRDKDVASIAAYAYKWASEKKISGDIYNAKSNPEWSARTAWFYYSNNQFSPYGRVQVWVKPQVLVNETNPYNYFIVDWQISMMPGCQEYGNDWWNDNIWMDDCFPYQSQRSGDVLWDFSPQTTVNQQSVGVTLGGGINAGGGMLSGSYTTSYSGSEVQITCSCNPGAGRAQWTHDLPQGNWITSNVCKSTYTAKPGCTVQTSNGDILVDTCINVGFARRDTYPLPTMPFFFFVYHYQTVNVWPSFVVTK